MDGIAGRKPDHVHCVGGMLEGAVSTHKQLAGGDVTTKILYNQEHFQLDSNEQERHRGFTK